MYIRCVNETEDDYNHGPFVGQVTNVVEEQHFNELGKLVHHETNAPVIRPGSSDGVELRCKVCDGLAIIED